MLIKKLLALSAAAAGVTIGLLSPNVAAYATQVSPAAHVSTVSSGSVTAPRAPYGTTSYPVDIKVFQEGTVWCGEFKGEISITSTLIGKNYETYAGTLGTLYARCYGGTSSLYAYWRCDSGGAIRYFQFSTTSSKYAGGASANCSYGVTAWDELCFSSTRGGGCANSANYGGAPIGTKIGTIRHVTSVAT